MMQIYKSESRGYTEIDWLKSHHTFSFGSYFDPTRMGFRDLRVINEDYVAPEKGFAPHGHKDMEIITYVLSGSLEHKDSLGTGSIIHPGEVQKMSAGTGVRHSEFNPSLADPVHLLQIWIEPKVLGIPPSYQQITFPIHSNPNQLILIATPEGEKGTILLQQDVRLYASLLENSHTINYLLPKNRYLWIQIAQGSLTLLDQTLHAGDGFALDAQKSDRSLDFKSLGTCEFLLFDLC